MTYIIAEPCIDIKDLSCVDVCPVDCIHEFERILIIDPEECIDCGACEPECPVEAIFPEDALPEKWNDFVKINYAYGDGADVINNLTNEYATQHNVQNPPLEGSAENSLCRRAALLAHQLRSVYAVAPISTDMDAPCVLLRERASHPGDERYFANPPAALHPALAGNNRGGPARKGFFDAAASMEREARTSVRAHQGSREEAGALDQAGEGDRGRNGQQGASSQG